MELFNVNPSGLRLNLVGLRIFYLDLESTGLDVFGDQIVEIGVVEARSGAAFATTVKPVTGPLGNLGGQHFLHLFIKREENAQVMRRHVI